MSELTKLGKYQLKRELGKGSMGIVYEGFDPFIERTVAIKTILKSMIDSSSREEMLGRFLREAQAAGRLTHPNIVSVYEYSEDGDIAFIAMEFVKGKELKGFFEEGVKFSLDEIVLFMSQLLNALEYVHSKGVIHRDIKPANVIITEERQIKVADFGIAKIDSSHMTQLGTAIGTPAYMSPEQVQGMNIDKRTDIYSAGVILYQFLTGKKPFEHPQIVTLMGKVVNEYPDAPSLVNADIPRCFDAVVACAMAKNADERYASAKEFCEALEHALLRANDPTSSHDDEGTVISVEVPQLVHQATEHSQQQTTPTPASAPSVTTVTPDVNQTSGETTNLPAASARKSPLIAVGAVVLIVALGGGYWAFSNKKQPERPLQTDIKTAPVPSDTPMAPPENSPSVASPHIALTISDNNHGQPFSRGQLVNINVKPSRDAYLYCFMRDERNKISRFFPNRFEQNAKVSAQTGMQLPKKNTFNINASPSGNTEYIACFATEQDIMDKLVPTIGKGDIDVPTPLTSLDELDNLFSKYGGETLGRERIELKVK